MSLYISKKGNKELNKRVIIYKSSVINVGGNNETFEQHRDGSNDRLLRLKTKAH